MTGSVAMKSETEIRQRLAAIAADDRYHAPAATTFENAPLALIQMAMESEAQALAWVLGISAPKPRRPGKRRGK